MKNFAVKGVVLNHKKKFLILKRSKKDVTDKEQWDLPGGRLDEGEGLEEGLIREINEETSLEVKIEKLCSTWNYKPNSEIEIKGFTYLCFYQGGHVKISKEHSTFNWIYISEIEKFSLNPNLKNELIKIFKSDGKISVRDRLRHFKFSHFNL